MRVTRLRVEGYMTKVLGGIFEYDDVALNPKPYDRWVLRLQFFALPG